MATYHTFITLFVPMVVSFFATLLAILFLKSYLFNAGIIEEDKNKEKPIKLPSSLGLAVVFGTTLGLLTYIFGVTFLLPQNQHTLIDVRNTFAVALSLLLISLVGFIDDINVKSQKVETTDLKAYKQGLKQWQKPLLTIIGALPLIAINAGVTTVRVPFFGTLNLGAWYVFVILPLAILFASNAVNLLGGFDGLQTGVGAVALGGFLIYSVLYGNHIGALISAVLLVSTLALLPFNLGKVIPGDSFTYALGAGMISIMVMGNAEAFGIIVFMPWIIEFFLHLRRKFKVTDLGIRQKDGTFKPPYGRKIYSLTHMIMNLKRVNEREVALYISLIELGFVVLAFLMKWFGFL